VSGAAACWLVSAALIGVAQIGAFDWWSGLCLFAAGIYANLATTYLAGK
jgi:hypothetical protein